MPPGDDPDPAGPSTEAVAQVWALTPVRLVAHWAMDAVLWAVTIALPLIAVSRHPADVPGVFAALCTVGFAAATLLFAVRQLRAGTAVWIDPATHTVTVFRASGGTLQSSPHRVRRVDRGRQLKADSPFSPLLGFPPLRIVTADGTVYLTPFLGPTLEIADALTTGNSRADVDL